MKALSLKIFTILTLTTLTINLQSASALTCTSLNQNLSNGASGTEVKKLQQFLYENGYMPTIPKANKYGPATVSAVKKFQSDNKLVVTGVMGKVSREKVKELSCGSSVAATAATSSTSSSAAVITKAADATTVSSTTTASSTIINWDFNSNTPFILAYKDFGKISQSHRGYLRIVLPTQTNKNISKLELLKVDSSCGLPEKSAYLLWSSTNIKNVGTLNPDSTIDIADLSIYTWGFGGMYFIRVSYTDGTEIVSKYPIYTTRSTDDFTNLTKEQYIDVLKECKYNDKESGNRMARSVEIFKYNNKLPYWRDVVANNSSSTCVDFYKKNINAFAECTVENGANFKHQYCDGLRTIQHDLIEANENLYNACYATQKK